MGFGAVQAIEAVGDQVAVVHDGPLVELLDWGGGPTRRLVLRPEARAEAMAVSASEVAIFCKGGCLGRGDAHELARFALDTGQPMVQRSMPVGSTSRGLPRLALPGQGRLLVADAAGRVHQLEGSVDDGYARFRQLSSGEELPPARPLLSGDGTVLLRMERQELVVRAVPGGEASRPISRQEGSAGLRGCAMSSGAPAWTACLDIEGKIWITRPGRDERARRVGEEVRLEEDWVLLDVARDGSMVVARGPDHELRVVEARRGEEVARLRTGGAQVTAARFVGSQELAVGYADGSVERWALER